MPVLGRLLSIEVWDKPVCAGGQRIVTITGYRDARSTQSIDGDESCSFTLELSNDAQSELIEGRVLLYQYEGGAFDEYYLLTIDRAWEYGGSVVRVTGRNLGVFAHTRAGHVPQYSGGRTLYTFVDTRTIGDWWTLYIQPQLIARGYGFFSLGTIEPTKSFTLTVDVSNGMDLLHQLCEQAQCELRFVRNGTTDYQLHVVTAYNAGATPVRLFAGRNMAQARVATDATSEKFATRLLPLGGAGHDDEAKTIARARWKVTALDPVNNDVTVESPDGDTALKCIRFDGQFTTNAGLSSSFYVVCVRSARPFQLLNSYASAQKLRVSALGDLVVGDELEFREDQSSLVRTDYCWWPTSYVARYGGRVSGISGNDLTLVDEFTEDPVQVDGEWNGLRYEAWFFQGGTTYTLGTGDTPAIGHQRVTVASTASMAAGDLIIDVLNDAAPPWAINTGILEWSEVVTVVNATTVDVRRATRVLGQWDMRSYPGGSGGVRNLRVYRKRTTVSGFVDGAVASTDVITVSSPSTIQINDILIFFRLDGGKRVTTLPSSQMLQYGEVERAYTRDDLRGETDLLMGRNPHFDSYTNAAGAPDGYTAFGAVTRATTPLLGPGSTHVAMVDTSGAFHLAAPGARCLWCAADHALAVRTRVRTPAAWTGSLWLAVGTGLGALPTAVTRVTLSIGTHTADTVYEIGTAFDVFSVVLVGGGISGARVASLIVRFGVRVGVESGGTGAFPVGGFSLVQTATEPEPGFFCKTQRANTLWHEGNVRLDLADEPRRTYEFTIADMARLDPSGAALDQLDIGVPVIAEVSRLFGASPPQQRVVRIEYDHAVRARTTIQVDALPDRVTAILAGSTL
jgi:hypothetical protein